MNSVCIAIQAVANAATICPVKSRARLGRCQRIAPPLVVRCSHADLRINQQKQNLNEVENLYFHNSHLRGPKTYPVPTIVATQSQSASFPPPQLSFAQSRLSFRFGSSAIRNSTTAASIIGNGSHSNYISQGESNSTHVTLQESTADHPNATITADSSASLNVPENSSTSIHLDSSHFNPSLPILSTSRPQVPTGSNEDVRKTPDDHMGAGIESTPSPQDDQSPMDTSQNSTNHYPSVKYVRPRPNKVPPGSRAQISLTAKDMYNFGSSSTLTYDSFWSTHSGSNTPRSGRGSIGATPAEYLSTFQIPGDFTSGIQDHSRSTTMSLFPSSSNFVSAPVYLETARNPGGPT